jgi:hypothetical protein
MRKVLLALGAVGLLAAPAAAGSMDVQQGNVHMVKQRRGIYDTVRLDPKLNEVCGGRDPVSVEVTRTAGDVITAALTAILYTPAHLRVTCPSI